MMTPAAIYKAVRDFLIGAVVLFVGWRIYSDGKNAVHADQFKDLQHQVAQQGAQLQTWHQEASNANAQLAHDIHSINTTPIVVHDWMQPQRGEAGPVLPAATTTASSQPPSPGGVQPGPGAVAGNAAMRDSILAAHKRYWEQQLATWRAEHEQWPQP